MKRFYVILICATVSMPGCSPAAMQALGAGLQGLSTGLAQASSPKLMLFGGPGHKTYLGCLTCSEYDAESVSNKYGTFGSTYGGNSIFNQYSSYGSKYSTYSACSTYASDPPVIVDSDGNFYGRLTLNTYHAQISRNADLIKWLRLVCN